MIIRQRMLGIIVAMTLVALVTGLVWWAGHDGDEPECIEEKMKASQVLVATQDLEAGEYLDDSKGEYRPLVLSEDSDAADDYYIPEGLLSIIDCCKLVEGVEDRKPIAGKSLVAIDDCTPGD